MQHYQPLRIGMKYMVLFVTFMSFREANIRLYPVSIHPTIRGTKLFLEQSELSL